MEIFDLRHYTSADLRPLLESEAACWSQSMSWDYHSSAEMILRYVDSKILPGFVAVENGRISGYAFFVFEGNKGVIGDMFVDLADKSQAEVVRSQLLTQVIETLQDTPGIHRVESQLLVHSAGEVSSPFSSHGFKAHSRLFMELPVEMQNWDVAFGPEFEIRRWTETDFSGASQVITGAYLGHIDSEINDQYRSMGGSLRFLNNIVRFPGCGNFDPGSSLVAVRKSTGAMVGLLLCSRVRRDVGHVTQVCVLPEFRGRRIGEGLIARCSRELKLRDFSLLTLTVTEANTRAVELYRRMGFAIRRKFDAFVWEG